MPEESDSRILDWREPMIEIEWPWDRARKVGEQIAEAIESSPAAETVRRLFMPAPRVPA